MNLSILQAFTMKQNFILQEYFMQHFSKAMLIFFLVFNQTLKKNCYRNQSNKNFGYKNTAFISKQITNIHIKANNLTYDCIPYESKSEQAVPSFHP